MDNRRRSPAKSERLQSVLRSRSGAELTRPLMSVSVSAVTDAE